MKIRSLQFAWFMVGLLAAIMGFLWWRAAEYKAACAMIIQNIQQAMRSYQGVNNLPTGAPLGKSVFIGHGKIFESEPICPCGEPYKWSEVVPPAGGLMIRCSHPNHQLDPALTWGW